MSTLNINIQDEGQVLAPLVDTGIAGEDIFRGTLCYLNQDGKYWKADASQEDTCTTELRIVQEDLQADEEGNFIAQGTFTTLGLTVGERYYVSTTPGEYTLTEYNPPNIVRYIGTASSSITLEFNPSDVKHKHQKSDITDFNESDYATSNQGILADSALQNGDNISELNNDIGYLTSFTEIDPIFLASEAFNFVTGDKTNLDNQSGINTGDETISSIQLKRPLKTIEGQSLEGTGNIDLDKNDVGLSEVDNVSDLNKPISTATQNALNSKVNLTGGNSINGNQIIQGHLTSSSLTVTGFNGISIGSNASSNGDLKLKNGGKINARNGANSGNVTLLYLDSSNIVRVAPSVKTHFDDEVYFNDKICISNSNPPATSTSQGNTGQIEWDSNYLYICVSTNNWKRISLSTW